MYQIGHAQKDHKKREYNPVCGSLLCENTSNECICYFMIDIGER